MMELPIKQNDAAPILADFLLFLSYRVVTQWKKPINVKREFLLQVTLDKNLKTRGDIFCHRGHFTGTFFVVLK